MGVQLFQTAGLQGGGYPARARIMIMSGPEARGPEEHDHALVAPVLQQDLAIALEQCIHGSGFIARACRQG
mgnify:CR=1